MLRVEMGWFVVIKIDPDDDPEKHRDDRHGHERRDFLGAIYTCNLYQYNL
jgi:hypothetical protein